MAPATGDNSMTLVVYSKRVPPDCDLANCRDDAPLLPPSVSTGMRGSGPAWAGYVSVDRTG